MKKKSIMGLEYKWEVLLVYLVCILGFIFSFMKDKEVDKDVKFQYNQSGAMFIIFVGLNIISRVFMYTIGLGFLAAICGLIEIVVSIFAIVAVVKAFKNETYEIPLVSDLAKAIWK